MNESTYGIIEVRREREVLLDNSMQALDEMHASPTGRMRRRQEYREDSELRLWAVWARNSLVIGNGHVNFYVR